MLARAFEEAIKPAIEEDAGYQEAIRVDRKEFLGDIVFEVIARIKECRFVVADATEHKNGVYFEAGYAMGMGLPVIWMCHKDDMNKAHFDTSHLNHIVWDDIGELRRSLANRILATIGRGPNKSNKDRLTHDRRAVNMGSGRIEMVITKRSILTQIDEFPFGLGREARHQMDDRDNDNEVAERTVIARMRALIDRFSPPASSYAAILRNQYGNYYDEMLDLAGVVKALRTDYEAGSIQPVQEAVSEKTLAVVRKESAMDVLISWSKKQSREMASVFHGWLPKVVPGLRPWMSSKDIDKGKQWFGELQDFLGEATSCIICVTS